MKKLTKNQAIASARAFIGPEFETIVRICNLDPINSWKIWQDNFGNKIKIYKNKSFKIINENNISNINDLYVKSSFELISKNSYWLLLLIDVNVLYFNFIGNDGVLRILKYENNNWTNMYPLLFSTELLWFIASKYLEEFDILSKNDCKKLKISASSGYITNWPPEDNQIISILKEKKIA